MAKPITERKPSDEIEREAIASLTTKSQQLVQSKPTVAALEQASLHLLDHTEVFNPQPQLEIQPELRTSDDSIEEDLHQQHSPERRLGDEIVAQICKLGGDIMVKTNGRDSVDKKRMYLFGENILNIFNDPNDFSEPLITVNLSPSRFQTNSFDHQRTLDSLIEEVIKKIDEFQKTKKHSDVSIDKLESIEYYLQQISEAIDKDTYITSFSENTQRFLPGKTSLEQKQDKTRIAPSLRG